MAETFFLERLPGLDDDPARSPQGFFPRGGRSGQGAGCELPVNLGLPLSRMSIADVTREVRRAGIVANISDRTVWRWLHEDAIRPWQHRCWIFPRDPDFRLKAGRILDLYGRPLERNSLARRRVRHLDGREDQHPSPPAHPRTSADRSPSSHAHRT